MRIFGLVLAGGRGQRIRELGPKPFINLAGVRLLDRVLERLRPQVSTLAISFNGPAAELADYGLPVLADPVADYPGPLGGLLAGLDWARAAGGDAAWLATVPVDAPFLPLDLVETLAAALDASGATAAVAMSQARLHPVIGLWPVTLIPELHDRLGCGERRAEDFVRGLDPAQVEFTAAGVDPFFNINTATDLRTAEAALASR